MSILNKFHTPPSFTKGLTTCNMLASRCSYGSILPSVSSFICSTILLTAIIILFHNNIHNFQCYASAQQLQTWEPVTHKTLFNPETQELANVSYVRYVKMDRGHSQPEKIQECRDEGRTKTGCSDACFQIPACVAWSIKVEYSQCYCYPNVFRAKPINSYTLSSLQSYEIKVLCVSKKKLR